MHASRDEDDWEVTSDGLYVATRGYLCRRGYCCGNQCRNCPYTNWRHQRSWQPISAEMVRKVPVSPKAVAGVQKLLFHHEQELTLCQSVDLDYHHTMVKHYRWLLQRWGITPCI